jgi:hypothetical protein
MNGNARGNAGHCGHAHGFSRQVGAEVRNGRDAVVERALIPEVLFGTANTAVARLDGEGNAVVPAG